MPGHEGAARLSKYRAASLVRADGVAVPEKSLDPPPRPSGTPPIHSRKSDPEGWHDPLVQRSFHETDNRVSSCSRRSASSAAHLNPRYPSGRTRNKPPLLEP